ncbi:MAG: UvrD-helicase domain-containing protein [Planctomycetota bacterium]
MKPRLLTTQDRRFPHTAIRASAGSGKTFRLTNRYLKLLAAGVSVEKILAITFTRKAAGEILHRLLERLARAALDPARCHELAEQLQDAALTPACVLELLRKLTQHLHRVQVSTLDSFFSRVARSFSLELGLPPDWRIVSEQVEKRMRAAATHELLNVRDGKQLGELMRLLSKGEVRRSVQDQISQVVTHLHSLFLEAPRRAWHCWKVPPLLSATRLQQALLELENLEIPLTKSNQPNKTWTKARDRNLESAHAGNWKAFINEGIARKIVEEQESFQGKPIRNSVKQTYAKLLEQAKAVLVKTVVEQTEATFELLQDFDRIYKRLKHLWQAMRFSDITGTLAHSQLLDELEPLYQRLDARLDHLLLDEFQDTARDQWRAIGSLVRDIAKSASDARSFFCVGDEKQAIYAWRGGVTEIFDSIDERFPGIQWQSLTHSYRSAPTIIDLVNQVFSSGAVERVLPHHESVIAAWSERFQPHTTAKSELRGHVTLEVAPAADGGRTQEHTTLRHAADRVAQLSRTVPGHSIGVLVRKNDSVTRLIYELRRRQVRASEEGGNPLSDSPVVSLLLSVLTLADQPWDSAARFHVATSTLASKVGLGEDSQDLQAVRVARQLRRSLMDRGYARTLEDYVEILARCCDERDLERLEQLLELAHRYEPEATLRPRDFIEFVQTEKQEDPTAAMVRVMTLHQAKGLEFDMVVLPELDVSLLGQTPQVLTHRRHPTAAPDQIIRYPNKMIRALHAPFQPLFREHLHKTIVESLNLLYVALTRAIHAVHMVIAPSRENEQLIPKTFAGILRTALTPGSAVAPGKTIYSSGERQWVGTPVERTETHPAAPVPGQIQLAPPPKKRSRSLLRMSPSDLEGGSGKGLAQVLKLPNTHARLAGSLFHSWFEEIEWLDDAATDGGAPDEARLRDIAQAQVEPQLSEWLAEFQESLTHPAIREALCRPPSPRSCTVLREHPFAVRHEDRLLTGSFDRLVLELEEERVVGADLIDFKTDRFPADEPGALEARVEYYRPQLQAYRRAVAQLYDLKSGAIRTRLLFVRPGIVREL